MKDSGWEATMNGALPLRELVFYALQQSILRGELKPGERLMEIPIANKLGVSRTPVREAIRKLEKEGLVQISPRKGAAVAEITEKDLRDVLEVRKALEELAVRLACEHITGEQIQELEEAKRVFAEVLTGGDVTETASADMKFHDVIGMAADNRRLTRLLSELREQMYRYRVEYLKDEEVHPQLIEEHERLADAICRRDPKAAAGIISRHIENQANAISDAIQIRKKS